MKSAKSNRSLRSIKSSRSMKSMKTNLDSKRGDFGGEFLDFATVLPMACAKFQCPYYIAVQKEQRRDEFYKALKYGDTSTKPKKISIKPSQAPISSQQIDTKASKEKAVLEEVSDISANTIVVIAVYDTYNCLTEILLNKIKVPRILMQVICLLVPYFQNLSTLTVRHCRVDCYVIYEISKMLELSCITSICLDDTPVSEQNYDMLITDHSNLRSISLCRCKINNDACKLLAAKLHYGASAQNLQVLNLSTNHITDIGAKYLSDALRSNRRLRYLNLADNHITDDGAGHILDTLMEFLLTYDEISNKRIRYMKYLKRKQALYMRYLTNRDNDSFDGMSQYGRKSTAKRKKSRKEKDSPRILNTDEDIKNRAETLASEILGPFIDPFDFNSVKRRNTINYCVGNMILSYLNLSYNNLSFLTVKKILKVIMYQSVTKKSNQSGLLKLVIDGNNLPMSKELVLLNEMLGRNMKNCAGKPELIKRKK